MPENAWFKDWFNSSYYHLLYQHRDETEATRFVQNIVTYLHPAANSTMLDIACGKGRHSKALADMGFDVTGIDLSPESIEEAKRSENDRLHFYVHDMRLPFRINYYHFAFNLFTSFGYFKTNREHHNAIRTMAGSLQNNGILVIDYLNVQYSEAVLKSNEVKSMGEVQFHINRWHDATHFYKQIAVAENNQPLQHLYTERVAKFSLADFTEMLSPQHMQVLNVFGDYDLGKYDAAQSPRLIIVAKKVLK